MYGIIYKITNKINGKPYVGQTTRTLQKRFQEHASHKDTLIGKAIRKYGKENFSVEIIEECETAEQLNEREIFWIAYFNCKVPNGYNLAEDGKTSYYHTAEERAKISSAQLGHPVSDEMRYNASLRKRKTSEYLVLEAELAKKELTYSDLARHLGIRSSTFTKKMRGERNFTPEQKETIKKVPRRPDKRRGTFSQINRLIFNR